MRSPVLKGDGFVNLAQIDIADHEDESGPGLVRYACPIEEDLPFGCRDGLGESLEGYAGVSGFKFESAYWYCWNDVALLKSS